jgi:hypothetical protein
MTLWGIWVCLNSLYFDLQPREVTWSALPSRISRFCQWRHLQTGHEMRSESWDKPTTDKRVGVWAFQQNSREMLGTVYLCDHPTLRLASKWLRTISRNMFCHISSFSSKFHWLNFTGWILWYYDIHVIYMWYTCDVHVSSPLEQTSWAILSATSRFSKDVPQKMLFAWCWMMQRLHTDLVSWLGKSKRTFAQMITTSGTPA